jgi:hypothetical protein
MWCSAQSAEAKQFAKRQASPHQRTQYTSMVEHRRHIGPAAPNYARDLECIFTQDGSSY